MELEIKTVDLIIYDLLTRKFEEEKAIKLFINENDKNEKVYKFKSKHQLKIFSIKFEFRIFKLDDHDEISFIYLKTLHNESTMCLISTKNNKNLYIYFQTEDGKIKIYKFIKS